MTVLDFAVLLFVTLTLSSSSTGDGTGLATHQKNGLYYTQANETQESSKIGLENNETRQMFLKRPPQFSVRDLGEIGVYDCVPNTEYWMERVTVKWRTPAHVDIDVLDNKTYRVNGQPQRDVEDSRKIYVSVNNSLVFRHLEKHYRGGYTCELSIRGNITAMAYMRLHVIDVSDFNVVQSLITGLVACAVCAALIFGIYFLVEWLRVKHNKKRGGEFELNAESNDQTAGAEKSASPMLEDIM